MSAPKRTLPEFDRFDSPSELIWSSGGQGEDEMTENASATTEVPLAVPPEPTETLRPQRFQRKRGA